MAYFLRLFAEISGEGGTTLRGPLQIPMRVFWPILREIGHGPRKFDEISCEGGGVAPP